MRRAYTWMPEKGTQTPSPSPDLFPAKNGDKTLTRNSHAVWYIVRGHARVTLYTRTSGTYTLANPKIDQSSPQR